MIMKVKSFIYFFVSLIANILITSISSSVPVLIISIGLLMLSYLLILYGINKSDQ